MSENGLGVSEDVAYLVVALMYNYKAFGMTGPPACQGELPGLLCNVSQYILV